MLINVTNLGFFFFQLNSTKNLPKQLFSPKCLRKSTGEFLGKMLLFIDVFTRAV